MIVRPLVEHLPGKHNQKSHGRQFGRLARAGERGGFTVSYHGDVPKTGYMVSPYKDAETIIPAAQMSREHVRDFIKAQKSRLAKPDHYIGGWREGDNVYLDVSVNAPTKAAAKKLATDNGQLAVYHLDSGTVIATGDL